MLEWGVERWLKKEWGETVKHLISERNEGDEE